jgi:hypothetical protein
VVVVLQGGLAVGAATDVDVCDAGSAARAWLQHELPRVRPPAPTHSPHALPPFFHSTQLASRASTPFKARTKSRPRGGVASSTVKICGVAWRGVAWRGVAWRGVAWRGVAWRGVARRGAARRGAAWRGVAWRGVARVECVCVWSGGCCEQVSSVCAVVLAQQASPACLLFGALTQPLLAPTARP